MHGICFFQYALCGFEDSWILYPYKPATWAHFKMYVCGIPFLEIVSAKVVANGFIAYIELCCNAMNGPIGQAVFDFTKLFE